MTEKDPIKMIMIGEKNKGMLYGKKADSESFEFERTAEDYLKKILKKDLNINQKAFDYKNNLKIHIQKTNKNVFYVIIASKSYSNKSITEVFKEIEALLLKENEGAPQILNNSTKNDITNIMNKYQDPKYFDKIAQIQQTVDQTSNELYDTINKQMESIAVISETDSKSKELLENAQEYKKNAVTVEHLAWWQNIKYWLILIGVIIVIVVIIVLVFVLKK